MPFPTSCEARLEPPGASNVWLRIPASVVGDDLAGLAGTADVSAGVLFDQALSRAEPTMLDSLYEALRMEAVYDADARVVTVTIRPAHVASACVRGGT